MTSVNPEILRWARETAGLGIEDAALKLDLKAARGIPGSTRLAAIEGGEKEPSRPLLLKMAKAYRRPLITFYLSAPPRKGERGQDFRTLPPEHSRRDDALVDALIRDVSARQEMVRALLEAEDEAVLLPFVGSMAMRDGAEAVLEAICTTLKLDLFKFRNGDHSDNISPRRGFEYLRECAERAGIFVLLIGNLGSHHTNLDVEIFRGFALADPIAPFIVINDQDARTAWSFTLLHELAHIWLGQTGVSGEKADSAIERFCNDVAGRFLLPARDVQGEVQALRGVQFEELVLRVNQIASERGVSSSMVAYKLLQQNAITRDLWTRLHSFFRQQWIQKRQAERDRDGDGGPNYYVVRRHRIGARLLSLTRRMVEAGSLAPSKAAKILGVKSSNVFGLFGDLTNRSPRTAA